MTLSRGGSQGEAQAIGHAKRQPNGLGRVMSLCKCRAGVLARPLTSYCLVDIAWALERVYGDRDWERLELVLDIAPQRSVLSGELRETALAEAGPPGSISCATSTDYHSTMLGMFAFKFKFAVRVVALCIPRDAGLAEFRRRTTTSVHFAPNKSLHLVRSCVGCYSTSSTWT